MSESQKVVCSKNFILFLCLNFLIIFGLVLPKIYNSILPLSNVQMDMESKDTLVPGDKLDNLFHFAHVSDTHYSAFVPERKTNFERFLTIMKDVVKPEVLIHTGDITDGEGNPLIWRVQQYEKEWKDYHESLLKFSHVFNTTNYHDVRGNHDGYGEIKLGRESMYYKNAISGEKFFRNDKEARIYEFTIKKHFGTYRFIAMDSYVRVNSLRPFHFFGRFENEWVKELKFALQKIHNHTILYGHYSLNTLYSPDFQTTIDLMDLSKNYKFIAHLFGHLHDAYGFSPKGFQTKFDKGHLELEVLDFKKHLFYRVLAYDHDILSFVDVEMGKWPVILLTNPKNCRFLSELEPIQRMAKSTHIRILIFSPSRVLRVTVYIDGREIGDAQQVPNSNLYVTRWVPERFARGVHKIMVRATAEGNLNNFIEQEFSLDGTIPPPETLDHYKARLLTIPLNVVFQMVYIGMLLPVISLLSVFKLSTFVHDDYHPKEYVFDQFLKLARHHPFTHLFLLIFGAISIILMYHLYLFGVLWVFGTYNLMTFYFVYVAKEPNEQDSPSMIVAHFLALIYSVVRIIDMIPTLMLWKIEETFFPNGIEFFSICVIIIVYRIYKVIS